MHYVNTCACKLQLSRKRHTSRRFEEKEREKPKKEIE